MVSIFIGLGIIIAVILIITVFFTEGLYGVRLLLLVLSSMIIFVALLVYIIFGICHRGYNEENKIPLFTYKQLKPLLNLGKIDITGETIYILYDNSVRKDIISTYSYFDFLRLQWLYNYHIKQARDLERQQHKAEVLQRVQEEINKEYEKIEKESAEVKNNATDIMG